MTERISAFGDGGRAGALMAQRGRSQLTAGPSVGIIVPCHNQSSFAAECLASIEAQTWANWRVVLIDDASADADSLTPLASHRVTVSRSERNLGRALVRNEGCRLLGQVDYILNVDCDDAIAPDYVERLVSALESAPAAGLAYGTLRYFGSGGRSVTGSWPPSEFCFERRHLENVIPGGGTMFRGTALERTAGWRAAFTTCGSEDYDIWLQVVELGWNPLWIREAVYFYRQHPSSFLSRSDERDQVEARIALLRFHHRSIAAAGALKAFLAPQVVPAVLERIRRFDWHAAARMLLPLLRFAPLQTIVLVGNHYVRQLSQRFQR